MNVLSATPTFDISILTEVLGFMKEALSIVFMKPVSYFLGIALICAALGIFAVAKNVAR